MRSLIHSIALCIFVAHVTIFARAQKTGAPSDSPQDSDIYQSSYLGGEHNIDPADVPKFTQLWNASFNPDEKVIFTALFTLILTIVDITAALGAPSCAYPLLNRPPDSLHRLNREPH
jgi:hypothetical protein